MYRGRIIFWLHTDYGLTKKVKLAGKPGSVVDSHSSRRFVT